MSRGGQMRGQTRTGSESNRTGDRDVVTDSPSRTTGQPKIGLGDGSAESPSSAATSTAVAPVRVA